MASKTTEKDLYGTLEITKEATEAEVKKAYKKMALKWHPDKNPDNTAVAEEKFKEIAEAYAILSNSEKRKLYDKYGYAGVNPSSPAGFQTNFTRGGAPSSGFGFQDFTFDAAEKIFEEFFNKNPFDGMGAEFPSFFGRRNRGAGAPMGSDGSPFSGMSAGGSPFSGGMGFGGASPFSGGSPFGGFGNDNFFKNAFAAHEKMMKNMGAGFGGGFGDFFGGNDAGFGRAFDGFSGATGTAGGVSTSVSTTTKIENGRKVTVTKTTTKGPDGVTKTEIKESVDDGQGNRHEKRYLQDPSSQKPAQHKIADQKPAHHTHTSHGHTHTQNHGHSHARPHAQNHPHSHGQTHGHSHGGHAHVRGPLKPHN